MKNYFTAILTMGIFCLYGNAHSQTPNLEETILSLDAKFWNVYNSCAVAEFKDYLTDDLEFYHDKGGLTKTSETLVKMIKENLCKDQSRMKLRREVVPGSVNVFPLNTYGAIISGEHLFYLSENGQPEKLVESAKFTHVWKNESGNWRMSRVLSYNHQKVNTNTSKQPKQLSLAEMKSFTGTYQAPKTGTVTIYIDNDSLRLKAGKMNATLYAASATSLYIKAAPIRFEFAKNTNGKATYFTVYENGVAVEKAKRID